MDVPGTRGAAPRQAVHRAQARVTPPAHERADENPWTSTVATGRHLLSGGSQRRSQETALTPRAAGSHASEPPVRTARNRTPAEVGGGWRRGTRPGMVRVTPCVRCGGARAKLPCAFGTYSTQAASTRSRIRTVRRRRGVRVSSAARLRGRCAAPWPRLSSSVS